MLHIIPLPDLAIETIGNLKYFTGESEYVFASPKKTNSPLSELGRASTRIGKQGKVAEFRIHDLRRTVGSNITKLGFNRTIAGKVLNHAQLAGDNQVTSIYDRYSYLDEKREALQKWTDHIKSIIE